MAFRLGMKRLGQFARQMGTMVEAGLSIRHALSTAERSSSPGRRRIYRRLAAEIENGWTLSEAIERQGRAFPPLFQRMVNVGETAGVLEKVFKGLADYYELVRAIWVRLLTQLIWPVIEYFGLFFVLALVAYLRIMFSSGPSPGKAALRILATGMLIFCIPIVLYFAATRLLGGMRVVHEFLIHVPVAGNIMRTTALARFSWCMELMTDAGVQIFDAITWSLQATANGAFASRGPAINRRLKDGVPLHECLRQTGLFPSDYAEMIAVAEVSGSMPEMFGRLARNYFVKMDHALKALGQVMFWLVWIIIASVIIYYIFKFAGEYSSIIGGLTG